MPAANSAPTLKSAAPINISKEGIVIQSIFKTAALSLGLAMSAHAAAPATDTSKGFVA